MQLVKKVIFLNFKQTERLPDDTSVSTEEKRFLQKKKRYSMMKEVNFEDNFKHRRMQP